MKKMISIVLTVTMLICLAVVPVSADEPISYVADFDSEPGWLTLSTADGTGGAYTDEVAGIVTKAYGNDTENKAAYIKSVGTPVGGGVAGALRGGVKSGSNFGSVPTGTHVVSFDFMVDDVSGTALRNSDQKFLYLNGKLAIYLVTGDTVRIGMTAYTNVLGNIDYGTWARITIEHNPATGIANYTLVKNVDTAQSEVFTGSDSIALGDSITSFEFANYRIGTGYHIDNIAFYERTAITSLIPATDSLPIGELAFQSNNKIDNINLTLNNYTINNNNWKSDDDKSFSYKLTEPLQWDTEYTLSGTVTDEFGGITNVSIPFKTKVQPESLVEVVGFYNTDGDVLDITNGVITAKLRFWQTQEKTYTYFMGLYRDNDGKPEMIDVVAETITTSDTYKDEDLTIIVPTDFSDCYLKLLFIDNLTNRTVLGNSLTVGQTVLE